MGNDGHVAADDISWRTPQLWSAPAGRLPSPPVETKAQLLPVGQLAWENAERLFLRLLHTQAPVQFAKLFGIPGQAQGGIDAYARLPLDLGDSSADTKDYLSLQSRRVKTLTEAGIKSAVDDFLKGEWANRSKRFYFATSVDLRERGLDQAVRDVTDKLAKQQIEFIPWGAEEVSAILKTHPDIVDDFFGRPWVKLFCGRAAAEGLTHRLLPEDSRTLRESLRGLYTSVFASQGTKPRQRPEDDFVILDVTSQPDSDKWEPGTGRNEATDERNPPPDTREQEIGLVARSAWGSPRRSLRSARRLLERTDLHNTPTGAAADEWLAGGRLRLLIGAPGSGKSSLLRFAGTDLLSRTPQSLVLQREHGNNLPVWLPFGYLCRHLAESSSNSLYSAAKAWLTQQGAESLWLLVENALDDDRLLLLIDGIDEWSDIDAAERALGVLEAFLGRTKASAILSTRAYAVPRLNWTLNWTRALLAPLTPDQRRAIAAQSLSDDANEDITIVARAQLEPFLDELANVPELNELSQSPLFLTLLATTSGGEPLPPQRFKLYDRLIELLIEKHPQMRRRASQARGSGIPTSEFMTLFGAVAYRLRLAGRTAAAERAEMLRYVRDGLADDQVLGYPVAEARRIADAVLAMAEDEFGLILSHGAGSVGFLHRVLFDHLAGRHLATLPLEEQKATLAERANDPAWRDVLLSALSAHISPHTVQQLLDSAVSDSAGPTTGNTAGHASLTRQDVDGYELLAQALASNAALTPKQQMTYIHRLVSRVETHPSLEHRANLITSLVGMAAGQPARSHLLQVFKRWLTAPRPHPAPAMWALRNLPINDDNAAHALLWGLRHPEDDVKIQAALAAAQRFDGQDGMKEQLTLLLRTGPSAATQAAALYALGRGWRTAFETSDAIGWARIQSAFSVRVSALHLLQRDEESRDPSVFRPEERAWLLALLMDEGRSGYEPWSAMSADLVDIVAANDASVADFALETLRGNGRNGGDRNLAWTVACGAFGQDDRFKQWVEERLTDAAGHGLILYNVNMIPVNWRTDPEFERVLRTFVAHELKEGVQPFTVIGLADSLPSDETRSALLGGLTAWRPWSAAKRLVEKYPDDAEVHAELTNRLRGDFSRSAPMSPVAIDVLGMEDGFDLLVKHLREWANEDSHEHQVVIAQAVAEAWIGIREKAVSSDSDLLERTTAQQLIERHDPGELSTLCTGVSTTGLSWHMPSIIQAWPEQETIVGYARRALFDHRHITPGIADTIPVAVLRAFAGRPEARSRALVEDSLALLSHLEPELREVLAFELTQSAVTPSELVDTIAYWKADPDLPVRRTLLIGATRHLQAHQAAIHASGSTAHLPELDWLREQIRAGLCAYGPALEEDRKLAWIGMLLLGDLTLIDGLRETIGEPDEPGVELSTLFGEPDPILVDLVAAHWSTLQAHFGSSLYSRLGGRRSKRQGEELELVRILSPLATVATKYPQVAEVLRNHAASYPALRRDRNFLLWAKQENRGDIAALRALVGTLGHPDHRDESAVITSLVDIESWNVREEDFKTLLSGKIRNGSHNIGDSAESQRAVYAQLFPDDPISIELYADLERWFSSGEGRRRRGWIDSLAISFGVAPAEDIPIIACRVHERLQLGLLNREMHLFTNPLLRRLRVDFEASAAMTSALASPSSLREDSPIFAQPVDPVIQANPDLTPYRRAHVLALTLKAAGHLRPHQIVEVAAFLQSANPDLVVHDPFTNHEGPLRLATIELLGAR